MKYINAAEVLPEQLMKEIQKYINGSLIYIPQSGEQKRWGEANGTKEFYIIRNQNIRRDYEQGKSIFGIAEAYGLAYSTVKKIIYEK